MKNYTESAYQRAQKKVEKIKVFYNHLFVYLLINGASIFVWLFILRSYYENIENQGFKNWIDANFLFFTGVWTIIVIFHGLKVFKGNLFKKIGFSVFKNWEERKIKQFMEDEEHFKNSLNK
ncbi:2TM domain-containing protein [Marixanthomonas spongiae]|uniref:Histidine kinase n=1 Tax=Marixanthomonas spongiae TaxID=2174845 RepID=A0A2U0I463_9FLAO|nr:2TM domain-containing protein [Marixanthomonas spongiae]PVW15902.1 histidine kinase [Marixanthomonas spongiae]